MKVKLVSFLSTDKLKLPGLLYSPLKPTKKVAVWLHGMGDNAVFYSPDRVNALAEALAANDIALLAFNNRGAHNSKRLRIVDDTLPEDQRSYQGGTHYELIADCIKDIDGAVGFLKQHDFSTFYLLGHSTGANKICVYHVQAGKNPFSKYVLAGPGDDSGIFFTELGEKKFWQALQYAARFIETDPLRTMPAYTGLHPFSVQSAWDIMNPDGDYNTFPFYESAIERLGKKRLFDEYRQLDRPTLVIFGENDEFTQAVGGASEALNIFIKHTSNARLKQTDFNLVPDADHSFHGVEEAFARQVSDWLAHG